MSQPGGRIHSIDVARGVAMVLMAIDHVRVYAGVRPGGPRPGVFFTRWITNFVAPAFAFLAGTSAYLLGRRQGRVDPWLFANHPMMNPPPPEGYTSSLALLYAVFVVVIAVLYLPCRWYARRKAINPAPWMRYI